MLRAYSKSAPTGKRLGGRARSVAARHAPLDYANVLLTTLGVGRSRDRAAIERHPALVWAESGAMALTGPPDGPPVVAPGRVAACARDTLRAFSVLAASTAIDGLDGAMLLGERAAVLGLARRGTISAGGSCRLLRARDGWIAVNLARADDYATVPAWLEIPASADPWNAIAAAVAKRSAAPLVARARLLGLAAAASTTPDTAPVPWYRIVARGPRIQRVPDAQPLVLDLSALWAGPLASHLLRLAGARVIKVESQQRPDGARRGPAAFFDLLNAGKESVALDLATAGGRAALAQLVARADIVIESARPRALAQLGIDAATIVADRGTSWISITGYGRTGRAANWIAYGDDAATAAGLATATGAHAGTDTPLFCGDAIADPLTGMHAAVAALGAYRHGGGVLLSLALRDVTAHVLAFGPPASPAHVLARPGANGAAEWEVIADGDRQLVLPPRTRRPLGAARPFGADTDAVLRELRVRH